MESPPHWILVFRIVIAAGCTVYEGNDESDGAATEASSTSGATVDSTT